MNTPIYDAVAHDLCWSPDDLGPRFDLETALSAAGKRARDLVAGQDADDLGGEADD